MIPSRHHYIPNTINVDDWNEISEYIHESRIPLAGISLLVTDGDKAYVQAPFTEVQTVITDNKHSPPVAP